MIKKENLGNILFILEKGGMFRLYKSYYEGNRITTKKTKEKSFNEIVDDVKKIYNRGVKTYMVCTDDKEKMKAETKAFREVGIYDFYHVIPQLLKGELALAYAKAMSTHVELYKHNEQEVFEEKPVQPKEEVDAVPEGYVRKYRYTVCFTKRVKSQAYISSSFIYKSEKAANIQGYNVARLRGTIDEEFTVSTSYKDVKKKC